MRSTPNCSRAPCSPRSRRRTRASPQTGASAARNFFAGASGNGRTAIRQILRAARRMAQKRNRIERARSRYDNREWVVARRARTKHLIERGGLVAKARLVELADDDPALLLGAFLDLAHHLPNGSDHVC